MVCLVILSVTSDVECSLLVLVKCVCVCVCVVVPLLALTLVPFQPSGSSSCLAFIKINASPQALMLKLAGKLW